MSKDRYPKVLRPFINFHKLEKMSIPYVLSLISLPDNMIIILIISRSPDSF